MAREFGAEGIGLCRTEHMFFDAERIIAVREMILADDEAGRRARRSTSCCPCSARTSSSCSRSWPACRSPSACSTRRCTSSCPHADAEIGRWPRRPASTCRQAQAPRAELHEFNPMLGHRGCRLGITYPEIYEMQARAIFEAAVEAGKTGEPVVPEVMIPLVATRPSSTCSRRASTVAAAVGREAGAKIAYLVGTMIELPRAC
jgi:pyruvate, orthophosphate dikinase